MFFSPRREQIGFGVELELAALPIHLTRYDDETDGEYYSRGYQSLRAAMHEYGIDSAVAQLHTSGLFTKRPDSYDHWFLTYDRSIELHNDEEAGMSSIGLLRLRIQGLIALPTSTN